jgi:hypothetical protein
LRAISILLFCVNGINGGSSPFEVYALPFELYLHKHHVPLASPAEKIKSELLYASKKDKKFTTRVLLMNRGLNWVMANINVL